jgi:uncharacterized protein with NRDE domain
MCLIVFAWQAHPEYSLVVGANRDEWHDRPAEPAHWWPERKLLAGRDLEAMGTWLGVTGDGRFGAITNFRDPSDRKSTAPSRGSLVADFLDSGESPRRFLERLRNDAHRYNGFNLLLSDRYSMCYFGSREGQIQDVAPGVHGLSNHLLDEPWPKVAQAKSALGAVLQAKMARDARQMAIYDLLSDAQIAPDDHLPDTGVGLDWERRLSPALIVSEKYGTRCSTVLMIGNDHHVAFEERTRDGEGRISQVSAFAFERS